MDDSIKIESTDVSPSIKDLEKAPERPRYLVFCVGLSVQVVHQLRNAYRVNNSAASGLLSQSESGYDMKIIGFYSRNLEAIFNNMRLRPNLLILGPGLQAPYPQFVKDWVSEQHPSVMRVAETEVNASSLPHEEYYLRTYSVLPFTKLLDGHRIAEEIDYGVLVNLNYRRDIKIEDFDHHVISLGDIDLGSTHEADEEVIKSATDSGWMLRQDMSLNPNTMAVISAFFGGALAMHGAH